LRIVIAKIIICVILVATIVGTAMITMPNHDLVNHNSVKQVSVKSTIDEATPSEVVSTIPTTQPTSKASNKTPQNTQPTTEKVTEKPTENTNSIVETSEDNDNYVEKLENEQPEEPENDNDSDSNEEDTYYDTLLDIDNPDSDYSPKAIDISDGEREEIARIVMGEFGGSDFTGCALLAQCIRDAMAQYGYDGYEIRSAMQYYGYNSNPSSTAYEAVDWIFVGNAAVQHRILVMNNSSGGWHGTQNFVVHYQGVWFYDLW